MGADCEILRFLSSRENQGFIDCTLMPNVVLDFAEALKITAESLVCRGRGSICILRLYYLQMVTTYYDVSSPFLATYVLSILFFLLIDLASRGRTAWVYNNNGIHYIRELFLPQ